METIKLTLAMVAVMLVQKVVKVVKGDQTTNKTLWLTPDEYNPGRERVDSWGDPAQEIPPDMYDGWDCIRGGLLGVHKVSDMPKGFGKKLAENRKAFVKALRETEVVCQYTIDGNEVRITSAEVLAFCGAELDKEPEYFAFSGQRRLSVLPWTIALAYRLNKIKTTKDYIVQAQCLPFVSWDATWRRQALDNCDSRTKRNYSPVSRAQNACLFVERDSGLTEAGLARLLGLSSSPKIDRGAKQQLFRLARLNNRLPDLRVRERIGFEPTVVEGSIVYSKGGPLVLSKLDKEALQMLNGDRAEAFVGLSAVWPEYAEGKQADEAICERCFETLHVGKRPPGVLGKDTLKGWRDDGLVSKHAAPIGEVLTAIIEGKADYFVKLKAKLAKKS